MMTSSSNPTTEVERECTTTQPNWLELPRDITLNILQRLGTIEIITSACQVCPLWWNICKDPLMWRTIHMTKLHYDYENLVKICRNAVERSCGQLEVIDIEYFATDDLLKYIAAWASQVRCIRLAKCDRISDEGFIKAIKKLPHLEELDISYSYYLSKDSFEIVGCCCPRLKSLKYGKTIILNGGSIKRDEEMLAIAKTMPGLRNLKISGNMLSSNGILAILNGCPLLESLDLQVTSSLYLSKSLRKRCCDQIKDFILPLHFQDYSSDSDLDILNE